MITYGIELICIQARYMSGGQPFSQLQIENCETKRLRPPQISFPVSEANDVLRAAAERRWVLGFGRGGYG